MYIQARLTLSRGRGCMARRQLYRMQSEIKKDKLAHIDINNWPSFSSRAAQSRTNVTWHFVPHDSKVVFCFSRKSFEDSTGFADMMTSEGGLVMVRGENTRKETENSQTGKERKRGENKKKQKTKRWCRDTNIEMERKRETRFLRRPSRSHCFGVVQRLG